MRINDAMRVMVVAGSAFAAVASATAPKKHDVQRTQNISGSVDSAWTAVVDLFAEHNWKIDNLDKSSGLITTGWMDLDATETAAFADCGGAWLATVRSTQIQFNVVVRDAGGGTRVVVNTKFRQTRSFDNNVGVVDCNSTGAVERLIQSEVDRRAQVVARSKSPEQRAGAVVAPRGFFCATSATVNFCFREKAECERTREISASAAPDVSACGLVETAWCYGDRCATTASACDEQRQRANGLACAEVR